MSSRGKSAWLVTWEDLGFKHWGLDKPRVVSILPPRLILKSVRQIVVGIWVAQANLTLCERMGFGLDKKQQERMFTEEDSEHFSFGLKPFLFARKVKNLRCSENEGLYTLTWIETPIYRIDGDTMKFKLTRKGFEDSWTQPENDVFGSN